MMFAQITCTSVTARSAPPSCCRAQQTSLGKSWFPRAALPMAMKGKRAVSRNGNTYAAEVLKGPQGGLEVAVKALSLRGSLDWKGRASNRLVVRATASAGTGLPPAITLTPNATKHLCKLRDEQGGDNLVLRVGVKQGGCSGMSYTMDLEERANIKDSDSIIDDDANGFTIVCDPKSLLYLFGLQLDYSNELIGGGFQFANPNAEDSCGCGKSFSA